jgi:hypothetical protein
MFYQEIHMIHKHIEYDLWYNLIEKNHRDYNYLLHDNLNMFEILNVYEIFLIHWI